MLHLDHLQVKREGLGRGLSVDRKIILLEWLGYGRSGLYGDVLGLLLGAVDKDLFGGIFFRQGCGGVDLSSGAVGLVLEAVGREWGVRRVVSRRDLSYTRVVVSYRMRLY